MRPIVDFKQAPFIVIWEVTRACDLACKHCRAEAQPSADPRELLTSEGIALLDHVREEFGPVLFVLTGGDPLKRSDIFTLIRHGTQIGLRMTITPSVTPLLTDDMLRQLRDAGIQRIAMSLDGADAETHDRFRGIPGTFARTIHAIEVAKQLGLEVQINTTISTHNIEAVNEIANMVGWLEAKLWSVFQVVPTGRAADNNDTAVPTPLQQERLYRDLAAIALAPTTQFDIKTTAGQPYYRVLSQERTRRGHDSSQHTKGHLRAPRGVNDGNGFVFISHTGDICPSGFLPLVAGNVRSHLLATVYRHHDLFIRLREPETFSGKCARCEYNDRCGGSRSRTYALTGDPFASDPTCLYQPPTKEILV